MLEGKEGSFETMISIKTAFDKYPEEERIKMYRGFACVCEMSGKLARSTFWVDMDDGSRKEFSIW